MSDEREPIRKNSLPSSRPIEKNCKTIVTQRQETLSFEGREGEHPTNNMMSSIGAQSAHPVRGRASPPEPWLRNSVAGLLKFVRTNIKMNSSAQTSKFREVADAGKGMHPWY